MLETGFENEIKEKVFALLYNSCAKEADKESKAFKVITWLLRVSAHAQAYDIPRRGYRLVEITIREEWSLRGADNTGPAWWDVVLWRWAPAVNHRARDWSVQLPRAGGWGLLQAMKKQLVRREVIQLVSVLLMVVRSAVVTFNQLRIRFFLALLLLILLLSISVHTQRYRAVGVCEVFGSIMKVIAQVSLWWWGGRMTTGYFRRRGACSSYCWSGIAIYFVLWFKADEKRTDIR